MTSGIYPYIWINSTLVEAVLIFLSTGSLPQNQELFKELHRDQDVNLLKVQFFRVSIFQWTRNFQGRGLQH